MTSGLMIRITMLTKNGFMGLFTAPSKASKLIPRNEKKSSTPSSHDV